MWAVFIKNYTMKKLLFCLLISGLAFGQNVELLQKMNNSDSLFTRELAMRIFEGYKILPKRPQDKKTTKVFEQFLSYTLMPKDATEKDISDYMNGYGCDNCVGISFERQTRGGNYYLKIKGETYFVLKEASGEFLTMFPFWKKEVQPESTTDKTYESRPVYTYKNKEQKIWLNFWRVSNEWMIRNMSDRFDPEPNEPYSIKNWMKKNMPDSSQQ